jgi:hypothetical protein
MMDRRVVRLLASAMAAGGIAFGTSVTTTFANGGTEFTTAALWTIIGGVVSAVGNSIQTSLSHPPGGPE